MGLMPLKTPMGSYDIGDLIFVEPANSNLVGVYYVVDKIRTNLILVKNPEDVLRFKSIKENNPDLKLNKQDMPTYHTITDACDLHTYSIKVEEFSEIKCNLTKKWKIKRG